MKRINSFPKDSNWKAAHVVGHYPNILCQLDFSSFIKNFQKREKLRHFHQYLAKKMKFALQNDYFELNKKTRPKQKKQKKTDLKQMS